MADTKDTIRTDIKIDALAAIEQLKKMTGGAKSAEEAVAKFSNFLLQQSKKWNLSLNETRKIFQQLDAQLTKRSGAGIFNNIQGGSPAMFKVEKAYTDARQAAGLFKTTNDGVVSSLNRAGNEGESAFKRVFTSINAARIALGALVSMLLFQALQAVTSVFKTAIQNAKEFELSLYRLSKAEEALSMDGVEVSMKGLEEGIKDIRKLLPIFSKEDIAELIGGLALATKELGLSEKQLLDLGKAVAILNVNSTQQETLLQTQQHVVSSLLTSNARGVSQLGISFSKNRMEAKGLEMQLLKTGESLETLTDEEKAQIKFEIVMDVAGVGDAAKELENVQEILDTNFAKAEENKAAWNDMLTTIGQILLPFIPVMTGFFQLINDGFIGTKIIIIELMTLFAALGTTMFAVFTGQIRNMEDFGKSLETLVGHFREHLVNVFFKEVPDNAPKFFMRGWGDLIRAADETETALKDFQAAADALDMAKAQEALEDLLKDLEKLGEKIEKTERDFQNKLTRFDADALEDRQRLIEDYNLNVAQTLRQFALRRKELEDNYRKRELDDEAKFQEQLRQLREKFLYNLEDALRERDARQVLRLIDQYNMEKQALINENALKKREDAERQQEELQDLKAQEQERLRVMAEEHALRLQRQDEDSALRRSRMLEDHAQEIADLKAQREDILREAADKIAKEYDLNAEGAQAIYDLLNKYYGGDGILEKLVAQGYQGMLNQSVGFLGQLQQLIAYQQGMMAQAAAFSGMMGGSYSPREIPRSSGGGSTGSRGGSRGMASGGQFVATRPTSLNVGEGGMPELVSVIPLSKLLGGSLGVNGSGGSSGLNGSIEVAVTLSPDLEGRIIESAMDGVGDVIGKVQRSK